MARRVRRNKKTELSARAEPDSGIIFIASSTLAKGGQSSIIYNMTIPSRELQSHCMRRAPPLNFVFSTYMQI